MKLSYFKGAFRGFRSPLFPFADIIVPYVCQKIKYIFFIGDI